MLRISFLFLLALPLAAQPPAGFFPWWDSPLAKDLNLSEDQSRQIRAVVRDFRTRLIDLRAAVEKAEVEVQDSFNDDIVDQRRAGDAIDRLVAARSELTRALSQMSLRLRVVLNGDQWRELQKRRPRAEPGQMMRGLERRQGLPPGQQLRPRRPMQQPPPPQPGQQPPPPQEIR